jgi:hypothetical protein
MIEFDYFTGYSLLKSLVFMGLVGFSVLNW